MASLIIKKGTLKNILDYILVVIIIFWSGNPYILVSSWSRITYIAIFISVSFIYFRFYFIRQNFKLLTIYLACFLFIIISQGLILHSFSFTGAIFLLMKIMIGSLIFFITNDKFSKVFINVMLLLCIISLIFFSIQVFIGTNLFPNILNSNLENYVTKSFGIYTYIEGVKRNFGPFWEPGAFQSYINFGILLSIANPNFSSTKNKFVNLIFLITIITTYSTTGYLILFILYFYILFIKGDLTEWRLAIRLFLFIPLLFFAFESYNNVEFLGEKIDNELNADNKEFNPGRIRAFEFDLHYIKKSPLIGNGLYETRYSDDPGINGGGHGNGFSNFLASFGIPLMLVWYYLIFSNSLAFENNKYKFLYILIITGLLQGEPLMFYPFFLGLPFINIDYNLANSYNVYKTEQTDQIFIY